MRIALGCLTWVVLAGTALADSEARILYCPGPRAMFDAVESARAPTGLRLDLLAKLGCVSRMVEAEDQFTDAAPVTDDCQLFEMGALECYDPGCRVVSDSGGGMLWATWNERRVVLAAPMNYVSEVAAEIAEGAGYTTYGEYCLRPQ